MKCSDILMPDLRPAESVTHRSLGMVPVVTPTTPPHLDEVLLLEEALAQNSLEVTETGPGGQVPFLKVINHGKQPVLILEGEELVGGKQNRVVNTSILVPAAAEVKIPVSCMEAGRWHYQPEHPLAEKFQAGEALFRARSRFVKKLTVTESLRANQGFRSNQGEVWREVDESLHELGAASATRDFRSARQRAEERMAEYLQNLAPVENQVGAVFYGPRSLLGCELLGSAVLFQKAFLKILRSFAFEVVATDEPAPQQADGLAAWWSGVLEAPLETFPSPGAGEDCRLETETALGSALVWQGSMVHLSCFPKAGETTRSGPTGGIRRLSASQRRRSLDRRMKGE
ncbi:MAG: hypothetical protein Kow00109_12290 [Acidobacteriota bacterium]